MNHNRSFEDYLETILVLSHELPVVRSVDIAEKMSFSKASVSIAMKHLREGNFIEVSKAGFITLTESGKKIADSVYEKHLFLTGWLTSIGVDPDCAARDACEMEHNISEESFEAMKKWIGARS